MEKPRKKIGQILIDAGVIDEMQLKSALGYQSRWGGKLGKILVEMGFLDEDTMIKFLAEHFRIKAVNLLRSRISDKAFEALPKDIARKYNTVPVMVRGEGSKKVMVLAMSDPANLAAIDEISFITGAKIEPVLATDSAIDIVLKNYGNYDPEKALKQYYQEYATPAQLQKESRKQQQKPKQEKKKPGANTRISQASRQLDEELFDFDSGDDLQVVEGNDVVMLKANKSQAKKDHPQQKKQAPREPAPSPQPRDVILGEQKNQSPQQGRDRQAPGPDESPFLGKAESEDLSEEPTEEPLIEELSEVTEEPEPVGPPVIEGPPLREEQAKKETRQEQKTAQATPSMPDTPQSSQAPPELPDLDAASFLEDATASEQKAPPASKQAAPPVPEQEPPPLPELETPSAAGREAPPSIDEDAGIPDLEEPSGPNVEKQEQSSESRHSGPPVPLDIPDSEEDIELAGAHEFTPYQQQREGVEVSSEEGGGQEMELGDHFEFIPPSPNLEAYTDSSASSGEEEQVEQVDLADAHEFMYMMETPEERGAERSEPEPEEGAPELFETSEERPPEDSADSVPTLDDAFISAPEEDAGTDQSAASAGSEEFSAPAVPDFESGPVEDSEFLAEPPATQEKESGPQMRFESPDSMEESGKAAFEPPSQEKSESATADIPPLPDLPDFSDEPSSPAASQPEASLAGDSPQSATFSGDDMALPQLDLEGEAEGTSDKVVALPFEAPPDGAAEEVKEASAPAAETPEEDLFHEAGDSKGSEAQIQQDSPDLNDVSLPPLFSEPDAAEKEPVESGEDAGDAYDFGELPGPPDLDSIWSSTPPSQGSEDWEDFQPASEDEQLPSMAEESALPDASVPPPSPESAPDDLESIWEGDTSAEEEGLPSPPEPHSPAPGGPHEEDPPPEFDLFSETGKETEQEKKPASGDDPSALDDMQTVRVLPDESEGIEQSLDEISKLDSLGDEFLDTREVKQRLEKVSSLELTLEERENNFDELLALMMKKEMGEITQETFMQELRKLKTRVDDSRKKT